MTGTAAMDYAAALRYITSTGRFGIKLGLERTRALLDEVGAPDRGMRGVLVAGTNGKGSTCAFITSILRRAGYRVAGMPKPHLVSYTERVTIDGRPISEAEFAAGVAALVPAIEAVTPAHGAPTEFEILTALALRHAREAGADLLVCEVGMGGRLDATNVTDLGVKVITGIDLDHQRYLGDTPAAIAAEKAGIIRTGDLVVTGELGGDAAGVIDERVAAVGAAAWRAGREFRARTTAAGWEGVSFDFEAPSGDLLHPLAGLHTALLGCHQAANAAVAVAAVSAMARRHGLEVDQAAMREGLRQARWAGRLELFEGPPRLLLDGGHNPAAVEAVVAAVRDLGWPRPPVVLFAAMADKDVPGMLKRLPREWPAVFTAVEEARAQPAGELLEAAVRADRHADTAVDHVPAALEEARRRAAKEGLVLVVGSLYLAGAVRRLLAGGGA